MFNPKHDEPLIQPIWALRFLGISATILVGLSMLLKNPNAHSFCSGAAFGLLIGFCATLLNSKGVTFKDKPQPSDVQHYPRLHS